MSRASNLGNLRRQNGPGSGKMGRRFLNVDFGRGTSELKLELKCLLLFTRSNNGLKNRATHCKNNV